MKKTEATVAEIATTRKRLEVEHRGRSTLLEFDEEYLYERWRTWQGSGENAYPLRRLSPILRRGRSDTSVYINRARMGFAFLIAAVVIYFSEYHAKIPLAAPVLALLSIAPLISGARGSFPATCVQICDDYNTVEAWIPVADEADDGGLAIQEQFLNGLVSAIEAARDDYY